MTAPDACLNCGAPLDGPFCGQCGQRAVPAYPTLREYAGDAWEEMSGLDGRFARTLKLLITRPGRLTVDALEGRRAHYIKPLRLYLSASVLYFLIAAAAPNVATNTQVVLPGRDQIKIDIADPRGVEALSPEQRAQALENIEKAPPLLRPMLEAAVLDPARLRSGMMTAVPKAFFVMVPVFAGIIGMFYRRRRFMQHLTFALHMHAVLFLALAVTEVVQFTWHLRAVQITGIVAMVFLAWYYVRALRTVYGDRLLGTLAKSLGIAVSYFIVWAPVMVFLVVWAAVMR
jgi:hypothetical protein